MRSFLRNKGEEKNTEEEENNTPSGCGNAVVSRWRCFVSVSSYCGRVTYRTLLPDLGHRLGLLQITSDWKSCVSAR